MKLLNQVLSVVLLLMMLAVSLMFTIEKTGDDKEIELTINRKTTDVNVSMHKTIENTQYGVSVCMDYIDKNILLVSHDLECDVVVIVMYDDVKYTYLISPNVDFEIIPLSMGRGRYDVGVYQRTGMDSMVHMFDTYYDIHSESTDVFLLPNYMCYWEQDGVTECLANLICEGCYSDYDIVNSIVNWVADNIVYDMDFARQSELVPMMVDDVLTKEGGVCVHQSSVLAAMLRSVGIPTKIVWGYVSPNHSYHAWNMAYINDEWVRYDVTAVQSGLSQDMIEDDDCYEDYKYY